MRATPLHTAPAAELPAPLRPLRGVTLSDSSDAVAAIALIGDPRRSAAPLVRLHRGCAHDDDGRWCPRRRLLERALVRLQEDGAAVLVYYRSLVGVPPPCSASAPAPRRPLGVPDGSPGLASLRAAVEALGLAPARLLVPAEHEGEALLAPRDVGVSVVRTTPLHGSP